MERFRAQRLKAKWEEFRNAQKTVGHSYLNFGTEKLLRYLEYQYRQYQDLCYCCKENPLSFGKWLLEE